MNRDLSNAHLEDAVLLAYLDAELPRATKRSTEQHLQTCWKCRASIADLELQAQAVSKLLCQEDEGDLARAEKAKAKFLEKKLFFEARAQRSVTRFSCLLYSQPNRSTVGWFGQTVLETA